MGKGEIQSGGTAGYYSIKLIFERQRITDEIASIDARIAQIDIQIAALPDGTEKSILKLQKLSLQKRKSYLQNEMPADPTVNSWCADYTQNLSGNVGTVEIPGERGIVQIQPGYGGNAVYDSDRDGQLSPSIVGSPSSTFFNLSVLPGWQKWKPTFRHGTITAINGSVCDITLEAATSSQQSLDVNQTTTLEDVPFEYMECDEKAFYVGDSVLVRFNDQDWNDPVVIGFKTDPRPCQWAVLISNSTIYLFNVEGHPYNGTLAFTNKRSWGSGDHVWFLEGWYWVLSGGSVKINKLAGSTRDVGNETACTGLPNGINEFDVIKSGSTYYMDLTRDDIGNMQIYSSVDGIAWSLVSTETFSGGVTAITPLNLPAIGMDWARIDEDRFFAEMKNKETFEVGYPNEYFRIYRIGIEERWTDGGELATDERAWTKYADTDAIAAYHFNDENDFTVEGGISGMQILQIMDIPE